MVSIARLTFLLVCGASLVGCVTAEGVTFERVSPGAEELVKYGTLPDSLPSDSGSDDKSRTAVTRLTVVGNTSTYRAIDCEYVDEKYSEYLDFFETWNAQREPVLSAEQFAKTIAGWTKVKFFEIPAFWGEYQTALVPKALAQVIQFSGSVATFLAQDKGDLVVAHTNDDGVFIVAGVLCKTGPDYSDCAEKYEWGVFDSTTGQELDGKLEPKKKGIQIDRKTFLRLDQPVAE